MNKKLRKKAKSKVEAKVGFYICAVVFFFTTIILLMLGYYLPSIAFWLTLPIPAFIMVLTIVYLLAFGMPKTGALSKEWQEEEIEKEMIRLYLQKKNQRSSGEELSEEEILELKELERLEEKWDSGEEYV